MLYYGTGGMSKLYTFITKSMRILTEVDNGKTRLSFRTFV
jgi:hypothetical protein